MKEYISIEGVISRVSRLDTFMMAMYYINCEWYRQGNRERAIDYCRFKPEEDSTKERFITVELMIAKGKLAKLLGLGEEDDSYPEFDCEDFACAEAAYSTIVLKREALPFKFKSPYVNKLHAVVRYTDDGTLYDPSLLVGMKGH